jgi:CheY-like chemotaxis protein
MPELSGPDLCAWIHSAELAFVPYVVLLTAKNRPQQICDAFAAGANDYIIKPFNRDDLRSRLAHFTLMVLRAEAMGEKAARLEPIDIYRLDLRRFGKELSKPS